MIREAPDERFRREGDDLLLRVRVPLPTALSEGKIDVPALDGRTLRVPLKEARTPDAPCLAHSHQESVVICISSIYM